MEARLLVVADDPRVRAGIARALGRQGFEVAATGDEAAAAAALRGGEVDLVLLDPHLRGGDGTELCRRLRAAGYRQPIVVVSAEDDADSRVASLDAGADDHVATPFSAPELVARVRALLRRSRVREAPGRRRYADLELDAGTREVRRGGRAVELTPREFDLLCLLLDRPETALTREELIEGAWGDAGASPTAIDVYVGYLRRKLEDAGEPRLIHTVRGVGFALRRGD
jgi:two-component system, OmpR family, response regulator MprA